jgi:hypothetical protein
MPSGKSERSKPAKGGALKGREPVAASNVNGMLPDEGRHPQEIVIRN